MKGWEILILVVLVYSLLYIATKALFIVVMRTYKKDVTESEVLLISVFCLYGLLFILLFMLQQGVNLVYNVYISPMEQKYPLLTSFLGWFYFSVAIVILVMIWRQYGI